MNKQLRNDAALPTHFMTDEQQALADQAGKFFFSEFHHLNAEMDNTDDLPASVFPTLGEMGYLGLNIPPEFGGAGLDFTSACIITEQLSRASAAIGLTHVAHDNLCVNNIYRNANDDLRKKYLPGLCDGSLIGALGLTEPGAGSAGRNCACGFRTTSRASRSASLRVSTGSPGAAPKCARYRSSTISVTRSSRLSTRATPASDGTVRRAVLDTVLKTLHHEDDKEKIGFYLQSMRDLFKKLDNT